MCALAPSSPFEAAHRMFAFLLVVHALVAAVLVTVILMQRSEGGGLGVGGSSSGLMTARGAADFLTRATAILGGALLLGTLLIWNRMPQGRSARAHLLARIESLERALAGRTCDRSQRVQ